MNHRVIHMCHPSWSPSGACLQRLCQTQGIPSHKRLAFPFDQWGQYVNLIWYFKVNIKSKRPLFILSLRRFKYKSGLNLKPASLWKVDYLQFLSLSWWKRISLIESHFFQIYFSDSKKILCIELVNFIYFSFMM